jgi:hypothetical protein
LSNDNLALQQKIGDLNSERNQFEITSLLDRALEDKKITVELKKRLAHDYGANPEGLKALLLAMPSYRSITELLKHKQQDKAEGQWQWDDYEKNDPSGKKLKELRSSDPAKYKELFDSKFAA